MPCKINVLEDDGRVKIAGMKPTIVSHFFPEISHEEIAEIENALAEIINIAK